MNNRYFFLRHGKNIHQTEKKGILYCWPDDNPPCILLEEGIKEVEKAGDILKDKKIDIIYSSDILRARQSAEIVAKKIGYDIQKIVYEERFRDINWGIFGGKTEKEGWEFFDNNRTKRFEIAPPGGESWNQCQERMIEGFKSIEEKFQNKNILIVSHNDSLWLLERYIKGIDNYEEFFPEDYMQTGEVREIYE